MLLLPWHGVAAIFSDLGSYTQSGSCPLYFEVHFVSAPSQESKTLALGADPSGFLAIDCQVLSVSVPFLPHNVYFVSEPECVFSFWFSLSIFQPHYFFFFKKKT